MLEGFDLEVQAGRSTTMSLGWKENARGGTDEWSSTAAWTSERDSGPLWFSPGW
jgi:hypothetical protein